MIPFGADLEGTTLFAFNPSIVDADGDKGREMNHGFRPDLPHRFGERLRLAEVDFEQPAGGYIVSESLRQIVHHRNIVSLLE